MRPAGGLAQQPGARRDARPASRNSTWTHQDEATRRDSLRALLHADGGESRAGRRPWRACFEILESTGGTDRAGVCLAAAPAAPRAWDPLACDDPVDLSESDVACTKEDE